MKRICAVMLALTACSDDSGANQFPDANNQDSAIPDMPLDEPPPGGPVTVLVDGGSDPIAGVTVYFQTASGTLLSSPTTDATGRATQIMEEGGRVTVVSPYGVSEREPEVFTFIGVKPGDVLHIPDRARVGGGERTYTFTAPPSSIVNPTYSVSSTGLPGMFYPTSPMPMGVGRAFASATTVDAVLTADNGITTTTPQYIVANDVTLAETSPSVTFTGAWSPMTEESWVLTNRPSGIARVNLTHYQATSRGVAYTTYLGAIDNLSVTQHRASVGTTGILHVGYENRGGSSFGTRSAFYWKPLAEPQTYDLADSLLLPFQSLATVTSGTIDWSVGPGVTPDAMYLNLHVENSTGGQTYRWFVAAPYTDSQFDFPALPPALADLAQGTETGISVDDIETVKVPGGYDAIRATFFDAELAETPLDFSAVQGASGQALRSSYDPPPPS